MGSTGWTVTAGSNLMANIDNMALTNVGAQYALWVYSFGGIGGHGGNGGGNSTDRNRGGNGAPGSDGGDLEVTIGQAATAEVSPDETVPVAAAAVVSRGGDGGGGGLPTQEETDVGQGISAARGNGGTV